MNFEKDMLEVDLFYKNRISTLISVFEKNNINGFYAKDKEEALNLIKKFIFDNIKEGDKIGIADSVSLHQVSLFDWLYSDLCDYNIINPFKRLDDGRFSEFEGVPNDWIPADEYNRINERIWQKAREALLSDVFITSVNAVTMDGKLVATDGVGNRIAGIIYGPKKVLLVVGRNKIVENVQEAMSRISNIVAPINALRHSLKHRIQGEKAEANYGIYKLGKLPCVTQGHCIDCNSSLCTRHCTMVMDKSTGGFYKNRVNIIIVNENLGI